MGSMAQNTSEHNLNIGKYLDIFNEAYSNLELYYVDSLDTKKHIEGALKYLLHQIDPYNEYYSNEEKEDLKMMSTGKYAGVGSIISYNTKADRCIIAEPYEGMPADKAGLKRGDIIIAIDGEEIEPCGKGNRQDYSSKVSNAMRGEPGTTLEITIRRKGNEEPITFHIKRETIALPSVDYFELMDDSIGYISLDSYTNQTAREMRHAVVSLKEAGAQKLIIDLRGNGGGLMLAAAEVVNLFLPKGLDVVSTKGRHEGMNSTMKTTSEPIDKDIPIVVLTSFNTASAAEITAGALQDYDRAVVMGHRTYGKGLVQQGMPLPHSTSIKITTSKYYIPSGRCIQAYQYKDGVPQHLPDSLAKTFYTKGGRPVLDGGGITPDVLLSNDTLPNLITYLSLSEQLLDYTIDYRLKHPTIASPKDFRLTAEEYDEFQKYLKENGFTYDRESQEVLKKLRHFAEMEGYAEEAKAELDALESKLHHNEAYDFKKWEADIRRVVETSIIVDYYYAKGGTAYNLQFDKDVQAAKELLKDTQRYYKILQPEK